MGCWNESCMVTGLPICYRESCSVVLLIESPYQNHGCYASHTWAPLFIMDGIYDDYGCIEEESTENYRELTKLVLDCLPYHMPENIQNPFGTLITDASGNQVKLDCHHGVTEDAKAELRIFPVFLRKDISKLAAENMTDHEYEKSAIERLFSEIKSEVTYTTDDEKEQIRSECRLHDKIADLMRMISPSAPNPVLRKFLTDCMQTNAKVAIPVVTRLIELTCLLEDLRKSWHIPSGSGSQESLNPAQQKFADLYANNLEDLIRRYDD